MKSLARRNKDSLDELRCGEYDDLETDMQGYIDRLGFRQALVDRKIAARRDEGAELGKRAGKRARFWGRAFLGGVALVSAFYNPLLSLCALLPLRWVDKAAARRGEKAARAFAAKNKDYFEKLAEVQAQNNQNLRNFVNEHMQELADSGHAPRLIEKWPDVARAFATHAVRQLREDAHTRAVKEALDRARMRWN